MTEPTPTPADEIRAAATRLHALATEAATDGRGTTTSRWHFTERNPGSGYLYAENPHGPGVRLIQGGSSGPHGRGIHPGMRARHGEYAAAMDPTVGLALADWLDAVADQIAAVEQRYRDRTAGESMAPHALAVARAINGRTAP